MFIGHNILISLLFFFLLRDGLCSFCISFIISCIDISHILIKMFWNCNFITTFRIISSTLEFDKRKRVTVELTKEMSVNASVFARNVLGLKWIICVSRRTSYCVMIEASWLWTVHLTSNVLARAHRSYVKGPSSSSQKAADGKVNNSSFRIYECIANFSWAFWKERWSEPSVRCRRNIG